MAPRLRTILVIFCSVVIPLINADPYRMSFANGEAITTSTQVQSLFSNCHQITSRSSTKSEETDAYALKTREVDSNVHTDDISVTTPDALHYNSTIVQNILQTQTSSRSLGLWFVTSNSSADLSEKVNHRARELESLPEEIRRYLLDYSDDYGFYTFDDSGFLLHLDAPANSGIGSCLQWMWDRRWKQAHVIAHVKVEDMPDAVVQWIRDNPKQTTFYIVQGVAFFVPGALYGPVLSWLGWKAFGVGAGTFAAFLQTTLYAGAVPAGGWFATLTSAAMFGYGASIVGGVTAGAAVLAGAGSLGHELWKCLSNGTMPSM